MSGDRNADDGDDGSHRSGGDSLGKVGSEEVSGDGSGEEKAGEPPIDGACRDEPDDGGGVAKQAEQGLESVHAVDVAQTDELRGPRGSAVRASAFAAGAPALAAVVFLGLFGTAVGFTWYADGVMRLGATRAGLYINLVPVFAVLQGALLLGERIGAASLAGGLLVIGGVLLATLHHGAPAQATGGHA